MCLLRHIIPTRGRKLYVYKLIQNTYTYVYVSIRSTVVCGGELVLDEDQNIILTYLRQHHLIDRFKCLHFNTAYHIKQINKIISI